MKITHAAKCFRDMSLAGKMYGYKGRTSLLLEISILKVVMYFNIFRYPVSKEEIGLFLDHKAEATDLDAAMHNLVEEGRLFQQEQYYFIHNDPSLVDRRKLGNSRAKPLLAKAFAIARLLFRFPYVRGIGISGSLSKNFADENADIDFFIITRANRLWIARTLMHMFKKLTFLAGKQHWFCMNYYVDEVALEIPDKNIFTAMELVTLLPAAGDGSLENFFVANKWALDFYPNHEWKRNLAQKPGSSGWIKKFAEWLFANSAGDLLDNFLLGITTRRWSGKEAKLKRNNKGMRMGLQNGKHFSKPNPAYFQKRVLLLYEQQLERINRSFKSVH